MTQKQTLSIQTKKSVYKATQENSLKNFNEAKSKAHSKNSNSKSILTSTILGLASLSLFNSLNSVNIFADAIPANLDLQGFTGINIDYPDIVDENPNSPEHSKGILLSMFPKPSSDVSVKVTNIDGQCKVNNTDFIYRNIDTTINLTVTAVTDGKIEEPIHNCALKFEFKSDDAYYNNVSRDVIVKVRDWNFDLAITPKRTNENPMASNHTNTISFKLTDKPSGDVKIDLTHDEKQCAIDQKSIVLNKDNWQNGVEVKVTAIYDKIVEDPIHYCNMRAISQKSNVDLSGKSWDFKVEVEDFNVNIPTLVNTGAKIIAPPFIGMLVIFAIWFFALKKSNSEVVEEGFDVRSVNKISRFESPKLMSVERHDNGEVKLRSSGKILNYTNESDDLRYVEDKVASSVHNPIYNHKATVIKTTIIPASGKKDSVLDTGVSDGASPHFKSPEVSKFVDESKNKTVISSNNNVFSDQSKAAHETNITLIKSKSSSVLTTNSVKVDRPKFVF